MYSEMLETYLEAEEALIARLKYINNLMADVNHSYNSARWCGVDNDGLSMEIYETFIELRERDDTDGCRSWQVPFIFLNLSDEDIILAHTQECKDILLKTEEIEFMHLESRAEELGYKLVKE